MLDGLVLFVTWFCGTAGQFGTQVAILDYWKWFARRCENSKGRNRDEAVLGLFGLFRVVQDAIITISIQNRASENTNSVALFYFNTSKLHI